MAVEFKLPKIAEGVESGDVLEILVSVGDTLEIEQEVMELETDKATIFVPSDVEGVITGINCDIGDTIAVGQVILSVEPATAAAAPAPVESAPAAPVAEKPAETVQEPVAPVAPVQPVAPVPPVAPVVSKSESALVKKASGEKVMVAAGPAIRRWSHCSRRRSESGSGGKSSRRWSILRPGGKSIRWLWSGSHRKDAEDSSDNC